MRCARRGVPALLLTILSSPLLWGAPQQAAAEALPEDLTEARSLAEAGDGAAQCRVGVYYLEGPKDVRDMAQARAWFEKAATNGQVEAQRRLGQLFHFLDPDHHEAGEAARWYALAAKQGDAAAEYGLGKLYLEGAGVPRDPNRALELLRSAAGRGNARAQVKLGDLYRQGEEVPLDAAEAVRYYEQAAATGDPEGQLRLGYYKFDQGLVGAPDKAKAFALFLKAAQQGLADAQHNVGVSYALGDGVDQDCALADEWYRRAAEQGKVDSMGGLAHFNATFDADTALQGQCTAPPEESVKWLRKAAEGRDPKACTALGLIYSKGLGGMTIDHEEAVKWFRKGAELGESFSQACLGWKYSHGSGVATDYAQAVRWQRLSAAQGDSVGLCELGHLYENGWGVRQNDAEALRLYQESASLDNADCQYSLGVFSRDGRATPRDPVTSLFWFSLADTPEIPQAQAAVADLRRSLTPAQLAEVESRLSQRKPTAK